MDFKSCIDKEHSILMEGALGERLKREYHLQFNDQVAMADLIYDAKGQSALASLWQEYIHIAGCHGLPFLATTPTRRANKERVALAGYSSSIITDNVKFLRGMQQKSGIEMYVGGLMGAKGDAYTGKPALSQEEARSFHQWQAGLFLKAKADFLYVGIIPALPEAAGMAQAMADTGLPYIISFTIQKDGKLIDGTAIADAIAYIDGLVQPKPVCYMTNCVHPGIVYQALSQPFNQNALVHSRFRGIQANTSPLSYAELDGSLDLKCSDPVQFAEEMMKLRRISSMNIFGGCCGTDGRHMEQVARRLRA
ncbi:homocysteine S-methyltransferase [Clostridium sp. ASBs410]|nr:homocysteine S-methyltransferase [Clostridium sp. ASBs410]